MPRHQFHCIEPLESRIAPAALTITNAAIVEGNAGTSVLTFTVSLDAPQASDTTVHFRTQDGSATTGNNDYTGIADTILTIPAGELSETIDVTIKGDTSVEAFENFFVQLSNPSAGVAISDDTGIGTIKNDEANLSIDNVSVVEGQAGPKLMTFTVSLDQALAGSTDVHYQTIDGTATNSDSDFDAISDTILTFAEGETSKTIDVTVNSDTKSEAHETFSVKLSGATNNATISDDTGVGTIQNDDANISITDVTTVEGLLGTHNLVFTITLDNPSVLPIMVHYQTQNGTATIANNDYVAITDTVLTFDPGQTTKTVAVGVNGDLTEEPTEHFLLQLSNPTNATISVSSAKGIILDDDHLVDVDVGGKSVHYTDVDGDLVTITTDKGSFKAADFTLLTVADETAPGFQLAILDLADEKNFGGANISIIAETQNGIGDGLANVGFISSSNFSLGKVIVDGDLGRIEAKNLSVLKVASLGALGLTTQSEGVASLLSDITGDLGGLKVTTGDVKDAHVRVGGDIGSIFIAGALRGGDAANSGQISFGGDLGKATIKGGIIGGKGADSGALLGSIPGFSKINSLILGAKPADANAPLPDVLAGGEGAGSGTVEALRIGHVVFHGNLHGGSGQTSGLLNANKIDELFIDGSIIGGDKMDDTKNASRSGYVFAGSIDDRVVIRGSIIGGSGELSGIFESAGMVPKIKVKGDLVGGTGGGAGQLFLTKAPSLSLGDGGDAIIGGAGGNSGLLTIVSGDIDELVIHGNVHGGAGSASGRITIGQSVDELTVFGSLLGGSGSTSGSIFVENGRIGEGLITGGMNGGSGSLSGSVVARKIGDLEVEGSLTGGAGAQGGSIRSNKDAGVISVAGLDGGDGGLSAQISVAGDARSIIVLGDVEGGAGAGSGSVAVDGFAKKVFVGDDIIGGSASDSGLVKVLGGANHWSVGGDIIGGSASSTGGIVTNKRIGELTITGSIIGGDNPSASASLKLTGFVFAGKISEIEIGGIEAGTTAGGTLTNSGSVRSVHNIGNMTVHGNVTGNSTNAAIITAVGEAAPGGDTDLAIGKLRVLGSVANAEILAGYDADDNFGPRGQAVNADASIGKVRIDGSFTASSIVAGVEAGANGFFGDSDDTPIQVDDNELGNPVIRNRPNVIATISEIIIGGEAQGTAANDAAHYAITAEWVKALSVGGVDIALLSGPGNDTSPGIAIGGTPGTGTSDGMDFHVVEIA